MDKWVRLGLVAILLYLYPVLGIIVSVIFLKKGYFKDLL